MIAYLLAASFALSAYGTYMQFEEAEQQAKLQKDNIELQRKKLELAEKNRQLEEDFAEAAARRKARQAQSQIALKQALSGTSFSSAYSNLAQDEETSFQSGMALQEELSGIKSNMYDLNLGQLDIQEASIQEPSYLDLAVGLTADTVDAGTKYYMYKKFYPEQFKNKPDSSGQNTYTGYDTFGR